MKVLFLCPSLVGAGVERRVCILLRKFLARNLDIWLGLLREEGEFLNEVPATRLICVEPKPWLKKILLGLLGSRDGVNAVLAIFQIRKMLRDLQPDIVVSFTLETTIPVYFARNRNSTRAIPWIISEDSNTALATLSTIRPGFLARFVLAVLGQVYRDASHVNCVSTSVERAVQSFYCVDHRRLSTLPNPVDWLRVQNALSETLCTGIDSQFIVSVGRLVAFKQFDLLIRAFAEVRKSHKIKLVILGEGPLRAELASLARSEGLDEDVLLPGFVHNPWSYMARAKMMVLTSKVEGFGNVIIESMAACCPVIATRCGGPEDIIRDFDNGLLVEQRPAAIAQAMKRLIDDPELCARLVNKAALDLPKYSPDQLATSFQAILDRVLAEQAFSI